MKRNWRTAAVVLSVLALGAVVLPMSAGAQKVVNPGAFTLQSTGGQIRIGTVLDLKLTSNAAAQCGDGIDNDADNRIDAADPQCVAGPNGQPASADDSELMPGFQPKIDVSISGNLAANGSVAIPANGVIFPPSYVPLVNPVDGSTAIVKVDIVPTGAASGQINPNTGLMTLDVKLQANLSGDLWGNYLPAGCSIGTTGNPILIPLTTERVPAVGNNVSLTGKGYDPSLGTALVVNNSFTVPGATGCLVGNWPFQIDLGPTINQVMQLPSRPGANLAVLGGRTTPVFGAAVTAKIATSPEILTGDAPFDVAFSAGMSTAVKGPATYKWAFGDGQTATGSDVSHVYATSGRYTATLTVTDTEGDSAVDSIAVFVTQGTNNPVPVARVVTTPAVATGEIPFTVGFDGSSSTVDDAPGVYEWTFGDGSPTASGVTASHTYTTAGTYTASLKVTDSNGDVSTKSVTVNANPVAANPVPVARVVTTPAVATGEVPFTVGFDGSSSTVDDAPGVYEWTFGDGLPTASGVTASHTYTTAGTYTASLKVTDSNGDVSTKSVTVKAQPKPVDPTTDDKISVQFGGSINYSNTGTGTGNVAIVRDTFGVASVSGHLDVPGKASGTARVTVNVQRLWILPFWTGQVVVNDPGSNVNVSSPVLGGLNSTTTPSTAGSTISWFTLGSFPNLVNPYSLAWSVTDVD